MLDFIGEIGTIDPWLWRGWAYVFSSSYRARCHARWTAKGYFYAALDIGLSTAVMTVEVLVVLLVADALFGALFGRALN